MVKQQANQLGLISLLLIATICLFSGIGKTSLYSLDEVKNAEAARQMIVQNDFITPVFNGELRTDKPPLHYYFMAGSYQMFGFHPFSARFFSAFMGLLTLLVIYLFTKKPEEKEKKKREKN